MENNNANVTSGNEIQGEFTETPVKKKEGLLTRGKNFAKKHKKGLIVGALAIGAAIFCATRKSEDDESKTEEQANVDGGVENTQE